MLFSEPTKYGAGLYLYGDYNDLRSLYATIHELWGEETANNPFYGYLMSLAYEIRYAYQGMRMKYTGPMELITPETGVYYGFPALWPQFLVQLKLLRDSASFKPTNREQQANLYLLEYCAEHALRTYDLAVGVESFERYLALPNFPSNYLTQYIEDRVRSYVCEGKAGKARFRKLPDILRSLSDYSAEYRDFKNALTRIAKEKNCGVEELCDPRPLCEFKW
jgi:hypothetical protein